jgi:glycosyltransferase 2 family protein
MEVKIERMFCLKAFMSVALVTFLGWWIDWAEVTKLFGRGNGKWLTVAFVLAHGDRVLMAYKWNLLLRVLGLGVSLKTVLMAYYIGGFWGTFLPSTIGSDTVRISWLSCQVRQAPKILSSVIVERMIGAATLSICAALSLTAMTLRTKSFSPALWAFVFLFGATAFAGGMLFTSSSVQRWISQFVQSVLHGQLNSFVEQVRRAVLEFNHRFDVLAIFFVLSMAQQLFPILAMWATAQAFGVDLTIAWAAITVPVILIVSRLPITISGIGVHEGIAVLMFSFAGVPPSASILIALTGRILGLLCVVPGAFFVLNNLKKHGTAQTNIANPPGL